jgi:hypothetical protein
VASDSDIADAVNLLPVLQTRLTEAVNAVSKVGPALSPFKQMIEACQQYRPDLLSGEVVAYMTDVIEILIEADSRLKVVNERLAAYYAERSA